MFDVREKPQMVEKALLIGVYFDRSEADETADLLEELHELVTTLGIGIAESIPVFVRQRNARFLSGKGKCAELAAHAKELECDCIVFDNPLSPAQQRAWEEESGMCVIDREEVILDIFGKRARSREARLQVELARMQYSLPRLTRMWTHLDRQGGGGTGGDAAARGEGEKQLEIDKRIARKRIDRLKEELEAVRKQRGTQRKEREREAIPHVAIVGYTNAGKSSLLNRLAGSDVLVEDKLFATLDTTTRKVELPDGQHMLMTDTVGFVRKLPHRLVESFKATLEEALLADFLIQVIDASDDKAGDCHRTTMEVLRELGAHEQRMLIALNKSDLIDDPVVLAQVESRFPDAVVISVKDGTGIDQLLHRINDMLSDRVVRLEMRLPQARADLVALIHREGKIISQAYDDDEIVLVAVVPRALESRFEDYIVHRNGAVPEGKESAASV